MIRVVLADDHLVVRAGLRSLLELAPDLALVGEAASGEEAVGKVIETSPDVLLLDVRMPRGDGLWVLEELARRGIEVATLVLTTFEDDAVALQALAHGARGYLLKDVTLEQIVAAVRTLADGGTLVPYGLGDPARARLSSAAPAAEEAPSEAMTEREREILRLLAGGFSNREIAGALHLAEGTVKNHVSSILSKMGVRDRTRAVLKAAERGFI